MWHLREITSDVFDVADRLKGIDERYRLFYNTLTKRYEVYTFTPHPALQVVLPFSPPDARCVEHVRKTRAERAAQLLRELEKENERIAQARNKQIIDRALECALKEGI